MIKWFGIIILATHFEFVSQSKYRYHIDFGNTVINRHRFDVLWRHVQWSHQPDMQDEGTSHDDHQWKLVEYFVTNFNESHTQLLSPLDIICADNSVPRCYG